MRLLRSALLAGAILLPAPAPAQDWMAGPRGNGPRAADVRCLADGRVLPAGVWYQAARYEPALSCPRPAVALVADHVSDEPAATAAVRGLRGAALAPGYPWAVSALDAGLEHEGVAVVAGLFVDGADATAWLARHATSRPLRIVTVLSDAEARRRVEAWNARSGAGAGTDALPVVTQVVATGPVPAFARDDVARAEEAFDDTYRQRLRQDVHRQRYRLERARRLAAATPVCAVAPGAVFVFPAGVREGPGPHLMYRSWMPVRCGATVAWIPQSATLHEGVVWLHRDGHPRVTQVTLVECDTPTLTTWVLSEDGTRREARVAREPGC